MSETFVVAVDGSAGCERALQRAIIMGKDRDATIILTHIIEWSPFSFHTPEELAERHARREEELARANDAILAPCEKTVKAAGLKCETVVLHGHPAESLVKVATDKKADVIFIGKKGQSTMGALLFGSVAGSLVQISPVAVTVVP